MIFTIGCPDVTRVTDFRCLSTHQNQTVAWGYRLRRAVAFALILAIAAGLYVASPLRAAWVLREAIKTGDLETVQHRVDWYQVRKSLRASLVAARQLVPEAEALAKKVRPTLWQRVKHAFGATMIDRFIETYITPEGLTTLFRYRQQRQRLRSGDGADEQIRFTKRFRRYYRRIVRAQFLSLTTFEIEVRDQWDASRRYVSVFELHGVSWKLTGLRILIGDGSGGRAQIDTGAAEAG